MTTFEALLVVALLSLLFLMAVLATIRVAARRRSPTVGAVPQQRVGHFDPALSELNRAYGEGRIGEDEYLRRRKELQGHGTDAP